MTTTFVGRDFEETRKTGEVLKKPRNGRGLAETKKRGVRKRARFSRNQETWGENRTIDVGTTIERRVHCSPSCMDRRLGPPKPYQEPNLGKNIQKVIEVGQETKLPHRVKSQIGCNSLLHMLICARISKGGSLLNLMISLNTLNSKKELTGPRALERSIDDKSQRRE